jgi:glycosyltransferase involved in cell wall biosynthesis
VEEIACACDAAGIYSISEATFAGGLAARRLRLPAIVHVIGMSIQSPRLGAHAYVRMLRRLTSRFVACSSAVAEMLALHGVGDELISVVHNGIDVAAIDRHASGPPPLAHPGPVVGMVAAYDPRKGHELFVDAAERVARERPDALFCIVGGVLEGQPESIEFERHIAGRVRELRLGDGLIRTGHVSPPDVYRWIKAMTVVVVPSRTEAFAHLLLEAMACRRAVVATEIEGNLDALVQGHSGLYVERSPAAVAAAVGSLLADPERARALGEAACERVRLFFDLDVTLPGLAAVVDQTFGSAYDGRARPRKAAVVPGPERT